MFIKIERLPGNPISCIFRCFRSFFTNIICSQSLCHENFTSTLSLSFLRRWYASMSRGDLFEIYQSSWRWSALCLPIRYCEHCQEYPSLQDTLFWNTGRLPSTIFPHQPIIFDNNELACITTLFSDPSWLNFWFNWRTWSRISFFADSTLLWSDSRIVMSSFLFNLSNASSVWIDMN